MSSSFTSKRTLPVYLCLFQLNHRNMEISVQRYRCNFQYCHFCIPLIQKIFELGASIIFLDIANSNFLSLLRTRLAKKDAFQKEQPLIRNSAKYIPLAMTQNVNNSRLMFWKMLKSQFKIKTNQYFNIDEQHHMSELFHVCRRSGFPFLSPLHSPVPESRLVDHDLHYLNGCL